MKNVWIITVDHLQDKPHLRGVCIFGPRGADLEETKRLATVPFRLYDDDGVLYYSGKMSPTCDFDPLDDFGMPNAGCTRIDVRENGKWSTL